MDNKRMEDWQKKNINGRIVARLYNIAKDKGETIYTYKYDPNAFEYQGRRISVGLIVTGVKVGDIPDDDDYYYVVELGDLTVCDDFRQVLFDLQSEEHNSMQISEYISFSDCVKALGEKYGSIITALAEIEKTRDSIGKEAYNDMISSIVGNLELHILSPFFTIAIRDNWDLWLHADSLMSKRAVYLKEPSFIEAMDKIKDYFDENLIKIKQQIQDAIIAKKDGVAAKGEEKKETGYNLEYIYIEDALKMVGRDLFDFKEITNQHQFKTDDEINEFLHRIGKELNEILRPEYMVGLDLSKHKLPIFGNRERKYQFWYGQLFKDKMQKVADYFDEHFK
jgi:hypothetical protein